MGKSTRVVMIDANKDKVEEFETQAEAAKMLGIDPWHIHAALRGTKGGSRLLNSRGISFMFYEEFHNLKSIRKQRVKSDVKRGNSRRVHALDFYTNEIIDTYDSMTEAAEDVGVQVHGIRKSCIDAKFSAGGYRWEYAD